MNTLLSLKNVSLNYQTKNDEITAIKDLSFDVYEGEFVSLIGPSGCGKTSVLSLIAGLLGVSSGEIVFNDKSEQNNIGYMLQKDHLFPWLTIEKNVFLPLEIKKIKDVKYKEYARNLLDKYGLKEFKQKYPYQLSGGMRQRAGLIRTLSFSPRLLLLDEPFSALDYQTRLAVCDDVYSIIRQEKKTALLVTHDITEAISMSDRIIVLSERPAKVKNIHEIRIDAPTPLSRREKPEFSKWFETIYKELNK